MSSALPLALAALALTAAPPASSQARAPEVLTVDAYAIRAVVVLPDGPAWPDREVLGDGVNTGKGVLVTRRGGLTFTLIVTRQLGPTKVEDFAARLVERDGPTKGMTPVPRGDLVRLEGPSCEGECQVIADARTLGGAGVQAACLIPPQLLEKLRPDCEALLSTVRLGRPSDWALSLHPPLAAEGVTDPAALAREAEARLAFAELRWADGLAAYEAALSAVPGVPAWQVDRALALLALARHDEAIAAFDRVPAEAAAGQEAARLRCEALLQRGDRLVGSDRSKDALADFRAAKACAPADARPHTGEARALLELDRPEFKKAEAAATAALALVPADPGAFTVRAKARMRLENFRGALADLDAALTAERTGERHALRSFVRRKLKDRKGADEDRLQAALLDPELIPLFSELGL